MDGPDDTSDSQTTDSSAADAMSEGYGGGYGGAGYSGGPDPGGADPTAPAGPSYEGPNPFQEEDASQGWGLGGKGNMGRGDPSLTPSDPEAGLQSSWSIGLQNFLAENGIFTGAPTTEVSEFEPGAAITGPANFGGVGSRGGVVDDVGAFLTDNPAIDSALSVLLGLANPALGIGYSALSNIARGNYGMGVGGLIGLANPSAGRAASMIGSLIDRGPEGALSLAVNEGSRMAGFNPGAEITNMLGLDPSSNKGTAVGIGTNLAAQEGLNSLASNLGSSWGGLGFGGEGGLAGAGGPSSGDESQQMTIAGLMSSPSGSSSQFGSPSAGGSSTPDEKKRIRDLIGAYTPASNLSKYINPRRQQMMQEQQNA